MQENEEDLQEKLTALIENHKELGEKIEGIDIFLRQISTNIVQIVEEIDKSLVELEDRAQTLENQAFHPSQPPQKQEQAPPPSQPSQPPQKQEQAPPPSQPSQPPNQGTEPTQEGEEGPPRPGGGRGNLINQLERALAKRKRRRRDKE